MKLISPHSVLLLTYLHQCSGALLDNVLPSEQASECISSYNVLEHFTPLFHQLSYQLDIVLNKKKDAPLT